MRLCVLAAAAACTVITLTAGEDGDGVVYCSEYTAPGCVEDPAMPDVVEDILGNYDGVSASATQLNSLAGVAGALEGVDYTVALKNGMFEDKRKPTAGEVQTVIDGVNRTLPNDNANTFGPGDNLTKSAPPTATLDTMDALAINAQLSKTDVRLRLRLVLCRCFCCSSKGAWCPVTAYGWGWLTGLLCCAGASASTQRTH